MSDRPSSPLPSGDCSCAMRLLGLMVWHPAFTSAFARHSRHLSAWCVTLERAVGASVGKDESLWASNAFDAAVVPSLPPAHTFRGLLQPRPGPSKTAVQGPWDCSKVVLSVPMQLSRKKGVKKRMLKAVEDEPNCGALLVMAGSHPCRRIPGARWLTTDVLAGLDLARKMKESGELPSSLELWAVANPMARDR
ncbi:unnamed protein product, partial [Chrysoparadoxa australica]